MRNYYENQNSENNKKPHCQKCNGVVLSPNGNLSGAHKWTIEILELFLGFIMGFLSALIIPIIFYVFKLQSAYLWDVYVIVGVAFSIYAVKLIELVFERGQNK